MVNHLYSLRTALLQLAGGIAAFAGMLTDRPFLAAAGFFTVTLVLLWTARMARRHPELVPDLEE